MKRNFSIVFSLLMVLVMVFQAGNFAFADEVTETTDVNLTEIGITGDEDMISNDVLYSGDVFKVAIIPSNNDQTSNDGDRQRARDSDDPTKGKPNEKPNGNPDGKPNENPPEEVIVQDEVPTVDMPVKEEKPAPIIPQTGDSLNIGIYSAIMLFSFVCVLLLINARRKTNQ